MMNFARAVFLVVVCAGGIASAQESVWRDNDGKPAADNDHQKSKDGFGALLLFTEDEGFFERWNTPDPPHLTPLTTATRGVPIHVIVIFAGPGRDDKGESHVAYDAKVLSPDGSVYGEFKDLKALEGKGAPDAFLQLSPEAMAIRIEPEDPAGTYRVEIAIRDKVKKVELKLNEKFEVKK